MYIWRAKERKEERGKEERGTAMKLCVSLFDDWKIG
jgi:hypothetical protein